MDAGAIAAIVRHVNDSWRARRYDDIGSHLADDVVLAPPGSSMRMVGREAYVQSYRDYDTAAVTETFTPDEPQIDVIGDVAVATCPFFIVYRLQGVTYSDKPFSGLDVSAGLLFRTLLQLFVREGRMILFSSHRLDVVEKVCSAVVILHHGRIAARTEMPAPQGAGAAASLEDVFARVTEQDDCTDVARDILSVMRDR